MGSNDPVYNDAEANLLPEIPLGQELVQRLVLNLAQDGVHHDQQSNG